MTRINCIPVEELSDKHLIAEYRELPRVFKLARIDADIPDSYRMGPGHVTFFYNKLAYLDVRFSELFSEMVNRGFYIDHDFIHYVADLVRKAPEELYHVWKPNQKDLNINRSRLAIRMEGIRNGR